MKIIKIYALIFSVIILFSTSINVFAQENEISKVAIIIKGSNNDKVIKNWLVDNIEEINKKNSLYNYLLVENNSSSNSIGSFQYVMEITPTSVKGTPTPYNYTTYVEKKVVDTSKSKSKKGKKTSKKVKTTSKKKGTTKNKKEEVKYKTIKVPVHHSGIKLEQSGAFVGRMYDVASGKYLNGFIVDFNLSDYFEDKGLRVAISKVKSKDRNYSKKVKAAKKKYLDKYNEQIKNKKAEFKKRFIAYSFEKIQFNTAFPFHFPQQIVDVVKKTKRKAKVVQLSGNKYLQDQRIDNVCALMEDDNGYKYYKRIAQAVLHGDYYDKNQLKVRFSSKKVLKAWKAKQKMIITRYKEQSNYLEDTIQKKYTVLPVFDKKPSSLLLYKVNYYLNDIPIFEVLDRGNLIKIGDVQKFLKSDKALDENKAFELRDKLKGADYVVLFEGVSSGTANVKLVETKTGKLLNEIKMDIPRSYKRKMNFYNLIVPAFKLNTEIIAMAKASSSKAKKVYVSSMFPLKDGAKYMVYKVENRTVNGEDLVRTIEVGELKISDLYSRNFAIAKIKDGGKDILKHFKKGDKLMCLPKVKKKKGILAQIFSFDFNFDNYENIHTVDDKRNHNAF